MFFLLFHYPKLAFPLNFPLIFLVLGECVFDENILVDWATDNDLPLATVSTIFSCRLFVRKALRIDLRLGINLYLGWLRVICLLSRLSLRHFGCFHEGEIINVEVAEMVFERFSEFQLYLFELRYELLFVGHDFAGLLAS